jgi:glycosyltransferase involved in cell wall biosynthesis
MKKILWLCPNLNHYKYKYLNYLNTFSEIEVTILKGLGREDAGDSEISYNLPIKIIEVEILKNSFGFSKLIRKTLGEMINEFDYIMVPRERKNLFLIIYTYFKVKNTKCKLFSYNHPVSYRGEYYDFLDILITRLLHSFYYKIIFYTKKSLKKALKLNLINANRGFFANNTIYTKKIDELYKFNIPKKQNITLLFIGRLIPNKNLESLFDYFYELKNRLNQKNKDLELIIIGDGPKKKLVLENIKANSGINYVGPLTSEREIKKYMIKANYVFNPGHSGLHINHSFCYGRPYITLYRNNHAPEIDYLIDGYNGYILEGIKNIDIDRLCKIFLETNDKIYYNAYNTGKNLSTDKWCSQIINAILA